MSSDPDLDRLVNLARRGVVLSDREVRLLAAEIDRLRAKNARMAAAGNALAAHAAELRDPEARISDLVRPWREALDE